jgi:hypothetical protein
VINHTDFEDLESRLQPVRCPPAKASTPTGHQNSLWQTIKIGF